MDIRHRGAIRGLEIAKNRVTKFGQIVQSLPERRQGKFENTQAEVQVFTKRSVADAIVSDTLFVAATTPNVHFDLLRASESPEMPGLQDPKKLRLQRQAAYRRSRRETMCLRAPVRSIRLYD